MEVIQDTPAQCTLANIKVMDKVSQKRNADVQVSCPFGKQKDVGIQCSES